MRPLSADPASATPSQLVVVMRIAAVVAGRPLARQLGKRAFDLADDSADRDAEYTLTTLHEVDDLVGGGAFVNARAIAHQRDLREVVDTALAQVLNGSADVLQRDAGVEQSLDNL